MTDSMSIMVMNKKNGVIVYNLKDLIQFLADKQMKLLVGLSSFMGSFRAESYLDQYRSVLQLDDSEFLFIPVKNTGFLELKEEDNGFPNNLLWCIEKITKDLKLCINKQKVENKVVSILGGSSSALVFTFVKSEKLDNTCK